jgi:hypothetical protein
LAGTNLQGQIQVTVSSRKSRSAPS